MFGSLKEGVGPPPVHVGLGVVGGAGGAGGVVGGVGLPVGWLTVAVMITGGVPLPLFRLMICCSGGLVSEGGGVPPLPEPPGLVDCGVVG